MLSIDWGLPREDDRRSEEHFDGRESDPWVGEAGDVPEEAAARVGVEVRLVAKGEFVASRRKVRAGRSRKWQ